MTTTHRAGEATHQWPAFEEVKADRGLLGEKLRAVDRERLKQEARRVVGRDDASDAVQEAYVAVVEHIADFRGQTDQELDAYLRKALRHEAIDLCRRENAHQRKPAGGLVRLERGRPGEGGEPVAPDTGPAERCEANELERVLEGCLLDLGPEHCEVVRLYYFEGLTDREIGDKLGLEADTARKRRTKALVLLRKGLEGRLPDAT